MRLFFLLLIVLNLSFILETINGEAIGPFPGRKFFKLLSNFSQKGQVPRRLKGYFSKEAFGKGRFEGNFPFKKEGKKGFRKEDWLEEKLPF